MIYTLLARNKYKWKGCSMPTIKVFVILLRHYAEDKLERVTILLR
jgi:hypothetical protein